MTKLAAALILSLSLAACNSSPASVPSPESAAAPSAAVLNAQRVIPSPIDLNNTPPSLNKFFPTNGANGLSPRDVTIIIAFSKAMNKDQTTQAFKIITSLPNQAMLTINWNKAGTVMSARFESDLPYGTVVSWKLTDQAQDLLGNSLPAAFQGFSKFQIIKQGTFRLYSDPKLDINAWYKPLTSEFAAASTFGQQVATVGVIKPSHQSMRAFLQFPLKDLLALSKIKKIDSATLNIYTYEQREHPEDLGSVLADPISTPLYMQEAGLWQAPLAPVTLANDAVPGTLTDGVHALDITPALIYNYQHPAQSYGLSQWRIKTQFDSPQLPNISYSKSLRMGLGADPDLLKRPYIEVKYEYL